LCRHRCEFDSPPLSLHTSSKDHLRFTFRYTFAHEVASDPEFGLSTMGGSRSDILASWGLKEISATQILRKYRNQLPKVFVTGEIPDHLPSIIVFEDTTIRNFQHDITAAGSVLVNSRNPRSGRGASNRLLDDTTKFDTGRLTFTLAHLAKKNKLYVGRCGEDADCGWTGIRKKEDRITHHCIDKQTAKVKLGKAAIRRFEELPVDYQDQIWCTYRTGNTVDAKVFAFKAQ
jgi:hypothetical protein